MFDDTLSDILQDKSKGDEGITFIENGVPDSFLSYPELTEDALVTLAVLQEKGIKPKAELIFQIDDNRTFITMFWACILGGIIPVPLTVGKKDEHKRKLFRVWNILNNPFLISSKDHVEKLGEFASINDFHDVYREINQKTIELYSAPETHKHGKIYRSKPKDIAFIQFSSGSTGNPKGVVLTHENLIVNTGDITYAARYTKSDSTLSWMPLTHDMGLIGFHINPLICGMNQYIMPTGLFVRRPSLWLEKSSEYGITILSSPNFGYKYLLKNCSWDKTYNWDLSSVRILYNGAEPISEKLAFEFLDKMLSYGLKRVAMCPVYGLAEASLAVSFSKLEEELIYCKVSRNSLKVGNQVEFVGNEIEGLTFVNVGKPIRNCQLQIVNEYDNPLSEEVVGRIMIKGDNVTLGYYNNPTENEKVFTSKSWLDTGDLGFYKNGNLFITGRAKDIIFQNGQNYYPHDLERIAEDVEGVELNKVIFGGLPNKSTKEEEILAFVFHRGTTENFMTISESVKETIGLRTGLMVSKVLPIKYVPRTTSGKLQRFKLIELYQTGHFDKIEEEITILSDLGANSQVTSPKGKVEIKLHKIWTDVLSKKSIGVNQNFFEIGGNSLKAAETIMKIWKEFHVELPLDHLYKSSTIRELAISLKSFDEVDFSSIPKYRPQAKYIPTMVQKRMYYFWELEKSSLAYNVPIAVKVDGDLNVKKLEEGIQELVSRNDSLRMRFNTEKELSISVDESIEFLLEIEELRGIEPEARLKELVLPFDLNIGPLFRIKLIRLKAKEYILFLDFHHSVSDGISVFRFLNQLMLLYSGHDLPEVKIDYQDFLVWEQINSKNKAPLNHKKFWSRLFDSKPSALKLSADFRRPPVLKTDGGKIKSYISTSLTLKLKALSKRYDCTLHVLLLSIYRVFLFKYTAQVDFVIGLPVHGRLHPDLNQLHGMFVNNLAIRNNINANETLGALVKTEKNIVSNAFKYQKNSFDQILNQSEWQRDPSRNLLFDTMFTYHNMGSIKSYDKALKIHRYFFDPGTSKFDLSMEIFDEGSNNLEFHVEYSSSLFLQETMIGFSDNFKNLISDIIKNPDKGIWEYSVLSPEEIESQTVTFNKTYNDSVNSEPVYKLFENQVRKNPNMVAIENDSRSISYLELDNYANALASRMQRKGVSKDSRVVLILEKSFEFIASIIATMKIGAAYVPIDTDLPVERITYIISDCAAILIVTDTRLDLKHEALNKQITTLDIAEFEEPDSLVYTSPECQNELAYVLYTSGTSGKPKGVMVGNKSLTNYVVWASKQYANNTPSNFSLFTSLSFDLTVTSILVPLVSGGKIVIYNEENPLYALKRIIEEKKVNIVKLTPSHLKLLLRNSIPIVKSNSIKKFIVGGEVFDTSLASLIYNKFNSNIEIYNEYGPTEATVGCMIYRYDPTDSVDTVPIGHPIDNTSIYLLDGKLKPVPTGVHGELFVSGTCLSLGYLENDVLNIDKFIPNPYLDGEKMYRTGDIGRRHPAGFIEYVGRSDSQVKINGYRIELGEIEMNVKSHKAVNDCIVIPKTKLNGTQLLTGYYVLGSNKENTTNMSYELNTFLSGRIPHYMIPSQFIEIENIPLTNNGKTNYEELSKVESSARNFGISKPEGKVEIEFIKIWKKVLRIKAVTVMDNFYEIGGDSIKAVQISLRCKEKGYQVTPRDILTYHSIRQIALRVLPNTTSKKYSQEALKGNLNSTPIQKWFFKQDYKNPNFYNQSVVLSVRENLHLDSLKIALDALVAHHDGLRINYNRIENSLFYNESHMDPNIRIKKYSIDSDSINEIGKIRTELNEDFDIAADLLLNVGVIYMKKNVKWLCISIHHLIIDGVSWRILLNDLHYAYENACNGNKIKFQPKTVSIKDWTKGLKDFLAKNESDKERVFWEKLYKTEFEFPYDFETDDWRVLNSRKISGVYGKKQTQFLLKKANKVYGTNVPILLLVALFRTLKDYAGNPNYLIEIENHGRHLDNIDVSRTIGWFTCMHRLFLELKGKNVEDQIKSMVKLYGEIPNKGINSYTNHQGKNDISAKRIPVRFNYLGEFNEELDNNLFSYLHIDSGSNIDSENHMTAVLEFNIMVVFDILHLEVIYNQKSHRSETIRCFTNGFFDNLDFILESIRNNQNIQSNSSSFEIAQLDKEEMDVLFE